MKAAVIGAGMAGVTIARELQDQGASYFAARAGTEVFSHFLRTRIPSNVCQHWPAQLQGIPNKDEPGRNNNGWVRRVFYNQGRAVLASCDICY